MLTSATSIKSWVNSVLGQRHEGRKLAEALSLCASKAHGAPNGGKFLPNRFIMLSDERNSRRAQACTILTIPYRLHLS